MHVCVRAALVASRTTLKIILDDLRFEMGLSTFIILFSFDSAHTSPLSSLPPLGSFELDTA